jgi:GH15 family glucan-1,4-alpha-glucosidase
MRIDGYAPIRDYAAIGDGRTVALVASDGAIDWLCLPNMDSGSVCAALLDCERGGAFELQPAVPFTSSRRYLPLTNVLETTFTADAGSVRVVDVMTLTDGSLGPQREVARTIEGLSGLVPMRWRFAPRFNYGMRRPRWEWRGDAPAASWGTDAVAVRHWDAGQPALRDEGVESTFEARQGSRSLLALAAAHGEPLVFSPRAAIDARVDATIAFWRKWGGRLQYDGPWKDEVLRSALLLKLLTFAPSGASAAAPTTSLPEEIGGVRNWDYRYCWIRDSTFLINALLQFGCRAEAQALFWWFMHATALTAPRLKVLYRLDGGADAPEQELPLAGYRSSKPVRTGNRAIEQMQLDIYGDLLETAWVYGSGSHTIDHDTGARLEAIADYVCEIWRRRDSGIWEVRGEEQHFTHSKVMCWVALDRAIRLAREGDVPRRHVPRWEREAAAIVDFVETRCWSERLGSYVRAADSQATDASLLMLSLMGFGDPAGVRMRGTIDAVMRELRRGPFLFRYKADDGLPGEEGCFLNTSFWLVDSLARAGRVPEAQDLMRELLSRANDVGLYSEEIQPDTGEFLGNFPQGLVHLSLIDAAFAVADALDRGSREIPSPRA